MSITSFYSGLQDSVYSGRWIPTGMPAMYKLMEGLKNQKITFDSVFITYSGNTKVNLKIDEFNDSTFHILGQKKLSGRLKILHEFFNFKRIYKQLSSIVQLNRYEIIYIDRANVSLIPILRKKYAGKIVLRLHGIGTMYQQYENSAKYKLLNWYRLFALTAPIDHIIATKDGTAVTLFLNKYANKNTHKSILINGVDRKNVIKRRSDKLVFLFLGRLESDKGINDVVDAFINLGKDIQSKVELLIVGSGSLMPQIQNKCNDISWIRILGSVPQIQISRIFENVDVTLSINYLGNISNVVLEAIANKTAIITLKKDEIEGFDIESNEFLEDNVLYVGRHNVVRDLKNLILRLAPNRLLVEKYQMNTEKRLANKLVSWDDRINAEINLLINKT